MPSSDGEVSSQDLECRLLLPRPSTSSDNGRALVPMWDSSDPERAPPPLPLNPQSPCQSRPNTSSAIQAHHAALTDKAREIGYNTISSPERRRNDASPDKALIKSAAHKRMQSLQPGHVRDLSSFIETTPSAPISPEKNNTRPTTPHAYRDYLADNRSIDKENTRPESPTPSSRNSLEAPQLRPSLRRPKANILGETSSPQSATMVAMSNMSANQSESALRDISHGSTAIVRQPQTFDAISTQILSLTSIATSLQREMAALSRRSKDNATDLVSLKEATHARDEDIRKSLRDLVYNISETSSRATSIAPSSPYLLDNKPHTPTSRSTKTISLPRIPSPRSFNSMERESTPSYQGHTDSSTSIALLEKVLRDMGTKEGQETLVTRLTSIAERLAHDGIKTASRLEDLVKYIKDNSNNDRALIGPDQKQLANLNNPRLRDSYSSSPPRLELDFDRRGASSDSSSKGLQRTLAVQQGELLLNQEILKVIHSTKDSVVQSGGLTAEVKSLVRELRGEVLGMGRDISRKLEESDVKQPTHDALEDHKRIVQIVQDGLAELKKHMDRVTKDSQRRSLELVASQASPLDGQEVYNAVKHALGDHRKSTPAEHIPTREEIVEAVKDAWQAYRPDYENYPEREEVLAWIQEGLDQNSSQRIAPATREEVFTAVVEGLKHFVPPQIETLALSRDEIIDAVRDCLEEFEFPAAPAPLLSGAEITKDDVFEAVQAGLTTFGFPELARANEPINMDSIYLAIKTGFSEAPVPVFDTSEVKQQLIDIMELLHAEFKSVKSESLQDAATQSHNIQQLLEAYKQGTEVLRAEIGSLFIDGKSVSAEREVLVDIKERLAELQAGVSGAINNSFETSHLLIKTELDDIRQSFASSLVSASPSTPTGKEEILSSIKEGFETVYMQVEEAKNAESGDLTAIGEILHTLQKSSETIMSTLQQGLSDLRIDMDNSPDSGAMVLSDSKASAELLTAVEGSRTAVLGLQDSFDTFRERSEQPQEIALKTFALSEELLESVKDTKEDLLATLHKEFVDLREQMDKSEDHEALMVAAPDNSSAVIEALTGTKNDILTGLHEGLHSLREHNQNVASGGDSILSGTGEVLDTLQENQQEILETLKAELAKLIETVIPSVSGNTDRTIHALQEGLNGLSSRFYQHMDGQNAAASDTKAVVDTLQGSLDGIRSEIEKLSSKPIEPLDQTLNYEILDTLKQGLEGLRVDIDKLHERDIEKGVDQKELLEPNNQAIVATDLNPKPEQLQRRDIDNLEVLITQLGIKVAAAESAEEPHSSTPPLAREDLNVVHEAIADVKASIANLSPSTNTAETEHSVRREDIQAVETLLRNTKAKIDDIDPEAIVRKEDLEIVEEIVRDANASIASLLETFDETSRKEDLSNVETLVKDIKNELVIVKDHIFLPVSDEDKATKTDVEAVEAVCHDIKAQIEQTILPEFTSLACKSDISTLTDGIKEVRTRLEANSSELSRAMEERQAEIVGVGSLAREINSDLTEFQTAVHSKLDRGTNELKALETLLVTMSDKMESACSGSSQILAVLAAEFEKSQAGVVGAKLESDEQFANVATKFEARFDQLMEEYKSVQAATEAKDVDFEESRLASAEAITTTKIVAEDIKVMMDVFGGKLDETTEKLDDSNMTVLDRVNETFALLGETHTEVKSEHERTQEQLSSVVGAIEAVQGTMADHHPVVLDSIKEVLTAIGEHYEASKVHLQEFKSLHEQHNEQFSQQFSQHVEDSKAATQNLHTILEGRPSSAHSDVQKLIEGIPSAEKYDDSSIHEKLDKFDSEMHTKLDKIIGDSYSDEHVLKKLDNLVEQMPGVAQSSAVTELLEEIHSKIISTSMNVTALMASHNLRLTSEHEDHERAAAEAALALQQRNAQKDNVEYEIVRLQNEEEELKESVMILKADHTNLSRQKLELTRDVSSLDTALRIRREELRAMEARAEDLERRIMEGVIDHSRTLLMKKSTLPYKKKKKDPMSLKRVPSQAVNVATREQNSATSQPGNTTTLRGLDMAMIKSRNNPATNKNLPTNNGRRILSLSQITGNANNGGMGRSQSVRTKDVNRVPRKSSWAGTPVNNRKSIGFGELNKENLALRESEEEGASSDGEVSNAGTMRRSSIAPPATHTMSESEYTESEYTESMTATDWTATELGYGDQENMPPVEENGNLVLYEE